MIHISKPYITNNGQYAYLKAKITITQDTAQRYRENEFSLDKAHWRFYENYPPVEWQNDTGDLYFAVPKEYKSYLCDSRSDAFVVAMLWYAITAHSDIAFEAPVSENLYFGITQLLIPALCKNVPAIRLVGPFTDEVIPTVGAVGTGMSCGVDSLYTLKKYESKDIPENYRLSLLTYYNMGAIFHPNTAENKQYALTDFYRITDEMSLEKMENAKAVAEMHGLQFLYVFSNLDKDYYRGGYGYTGVYRNCAMTLALQGLFSVYYCSSAGWPEFFDLSLNEGSEHYETLLCTAFSTEGLRFIISDYATRLEKTEALAADVTAQKYLDVCFNFHNCGTCAKCYRTLITLDALDTVDSFGDVFDVAAYKANRNHAFAWLLSAMKGSEKDDNAVFARDLYAFIEKKGIAIPKQAVKLYRQRKRKQLVKKYGRKCKRLLRRFIH